VWKKTGKNNKHFQNKVEEMMEMEGLKYFLWSTALRKKRWRSS
jgi:hypothetical protein